MLVGLVKKNGIMMVDFAVEPQREHGKTPLEAIHEACLVRFRPIMMTTMARWSARCRSRSAAAPAPSRGGRSAWPSSAACWSRSC